VDGEDGGDVLEGEWEREYLGRDKTGGTGELLDAAPIRFQSPFPGCKELVACNTCRPKYEGKKADQFFCNRCGKQISKIKVQTVKDDPDAKIVFFPGYNFETILVCNTCLYGTVPKIDRDAIAPEGTYSLHYQKNVPPKPPTFNDDCMPCPTCMMLIHTGAVSPDGDCPSCGNFFIGAAAQSAPAMFPKEVDDLSASPHPVDSGSGFKWKPASLPTPLSRIKLPVLPSNLQQDVDASEGD